METQTIKLSPFWTLTVTFDQTGNKLQVSVTTPEADAQECQFIRDAHITPTANIWEDNSTGQVDNGVTETQLLRSESPDPDQWGLQRRKRKLVSGSEVTSSDKDLNVSRPRIKRLKGSPEQDAFNDLPMELQLHIFSFLEPSTLAGEVQLVCTHWQRLAQDESLWRTVHGGLWDGPKPKNNTWQNDCLQILREVQVRNDVHATKMLLWAAQRGYLALIKHLLQSSNITANACNKKKVTALLVAAEVGHEKVVEHLLEHKADVEAAASKNATSLYMAAQHGHLGVVKMLLKAGANVNAKTDYGTTAVFVAAQMGNVALMELLLEYNADVNIPMNNAQTPLFVSVREGNTKIVQLLLNANADVNAERADGTTALVMAAYKGRLEIVKMLVEAGAKVNVVPQGGMNALFVAAQQGYADIVSFLLEHTDSDLHTATPGGTTPLLISTQKGHLEVVCVLLRHGANVRATLKDGTTTARVIAECAGFIQIAEILRLEETKLQLKERPAIAAVSSYFQRTPMQM